MEDIEKDLDKVSGGAALYRPSDYKYEIVESKDGKFFVIPKTSYLESKDKDNITVSKKLIGKIVESKDGKFFTLEDVPLMFDRYVDAFKVYSLIDPPRRW